MTDSAIKQTLAATYDELALEYERAVVPIFRPMAKRLIQLVDLRPGWRVLDVGTGTGLVATLAAPFVGKSGKIIGIDSADKMLDIARKKADQFGVTQCEFRHGDLEKLEFEKAQFDAALTQFALHHVDPAPSLRELQRVLVPGGTLAIHEWMESPNTPNQALISQSGTPASAAVGTSGRPPRRFFAAVARPLIVPALRLVRAEPSAIDTS